MSADINTLANATVTQLQTDLGGDVIVTKEWTNRLDLGSFDGRRVMVYPLGYADAGNITRRNRFWDLSYTIVVCERYTGERDSNGNIPDLWIDELVEWVEKEIYNRLTNEKNPYIVGEYWAQSAEVTAVVDFMMLEEHNVFWSEIDVTFRRLKT